MRENLIFEEYISAEYGCTGWYQYQVRCTEYRPNVSIHKNSDIMNRQNT